MFLFENGLTFRQVRCTFRLSGTLGRFHADEISYFLPGGIMTKRFFLAVLMAGILSMPAFHRLQQRHLIRHRQQEKELTNQAPLLSFRQPSAHQPLK